MGKEKTGDSHHKSKKINPPSATTPNSNGTHGVEYHHPTDTSKQHPNGHQNVKKDYWLFNEKNQPVIANAISLFMFLTTVALVIYTIGILNQTTNAAKATRDAANSTEKAAVATKQSAGLQKKALDNQISAKAQSDISDAKKFKQDSQLFKLQKQSYASNEKDRISRFTRDTAALNIQISTLKESRKYNEPNLQISDIQSFSIDTTGKISFKYFCYNLAKIPVKTIEISAFVYARDITKDPIDNPFELLKKITTPNKTPTYIYSKEYSSANVVQDVFTKSDIEKNWVNDFKAGKKIYLFFVGKIFYNNYTNNKKRVFEFIVNIIYKSENEVYFTFVHIDNSDV